MALKSNGIYCFLILPLTPSFPKGGKEERNCGGGRRGNIKKGGGEPSPPVNSIPKLKNLC